MPFTITQACNGCQACRRICPADAISGEKKKLIPSTDTVCIECGACGRICPQQADPGWLGKGMYAWSNVPSGRTRSSRMKTCMSCTICIDACPVNCLALTEANKARDLHGYPYLKDEKACIGCGFCAAECPVDAISHETLAQGG